MAAPMPAAAAIQNNAGNSATIEQADELMRGIIIRAAAGDGMRVVRGDLHAGQLRAFGSDAPTLGGDPERHANVDEWRKVARNQC